MKYKCISIVIALWYKPCSANANQLSFNHRKNHHEQLHFKFTWCGNAIMALKHIPLSEHQWTPVGPHLRSQRKSDLIRIFMRPYGSNISAISARASWLCLTSFAAFYDYISIPDLPDVSLWVPLFQYLQLFTGSLKLCRSTICLGLFSRIE